MGIGMALSEETLYDERTGRIMNPSLAEYHVPVNLDVPHIEVLFNDIPDPHSPLGAHGIGEIGITGAAAAIANAVYQRHGQAHPRAADHAGQAALMPFVCLLSRSTAQRIATVDTGGDPCRVSVGPRSGAEKTRLRPMSRGPRLSS